MLLYHILTSFRKGVILPIPPLNRKMKAWKPILLRVKFKLFFSPTHNQTHIQKQLETYRAAFWLATIFEEHLSMTIPLKNIKYREIERCSVKQLFWNSFLYLDLFIFLWRTFPVFKKIDTCYGTAIFFKQKSIQKLSVDTEYLIRSVEACK